MASSNKKSNRYHLDANASIDGTCLQGYITTTYEKLERLFGTPEECDRYKVSGQWVFKGTKGEVFTVYDYKSTNLYDSHYPSIEEFRLNKTPFQFNVGGNSDASPFLLWLSEKLNQLNEEEGTKHE